ncbi:MAG: hypothetical protein KGH64_04535, partial [Candidatus Micrarchaeota archaeon]|nr:hypothetical protein [Candidatus Micrarchaeota archaeon]
LPTGELLNELLNKKIVVKTQGGEGIKDILLVEGNYTGLLLGFDHRFIKLEYRIRKFLNGVTSDTSDVILINLAYVISIEEFRQREDQAN